MRCSNAFGFDTLETQHADSLDFHDCADALKAAFDTGVEHARRPAILSS
ncbi:DUF6900 domain-containing protein [Burkholderia glumae]